MKIRFDASPRQLLGLSCVLLMLTPALQAHNMVVHQDFVDLAYNIMIGVEKGAIIPPPPTGVSASDWTAFLNTIKTAPPKYRQAPTGLPAVQHPVCPEQDNPSVVNLDWAKVKAGQLPYPVSVDLANGYTCGVRPNYLPGGIFNAINFPSLSGSNIAAGGRHRDFTGTALGYWSASVDKEFDDTHLWSRPVNAGGMSNVWIFFNGVGNIGIGAIFAPFVCLGVLIFGDGDCAGAVEDTGAWFNKVDDLNGLLPGFGDWSGDDYTGVWHHIKILGSASNDYDDKQGLFIEEAGPSAEIDPFDFLAMVGGDAIGLSVDYDESKGPKRYEIEDAGDHHQNTSTRSMGEWQFATITHTAFEPLDNLAFYGWKRFRDSGHSIKDLGWPLHALGDASVPMHVAGTSAWGHRPFEDAYERSWAKLRYIDGSDTAAEQTAQATAILARAYEYRMFIKEWRTLHNTGDVPVRELVTKLAQRTGDYAMQKQSTALWPFSNSLSSTYALDSEADAIRAYTGRADNVSINQPLIDNGVGATLAFLMSAAELM